MGANTGLLLYRRTAPALAMLDSMLAVYEKAKQLPEASEADDATSVDGRTADDAAAGPSQLSTYSRMLSNYSSCPEQAFFNHRLLAHGSRTLAKGELQAAQRAVRRGAHIMKDIHWSVPTHAGAASVTVLDHERWPRYMVTDSRAYVSWPPAVRDRISRVLARTLINSGAHVRSAGPGPAVPIKEACLYHPFVPGNVSGTQGRGSQASYFSKDGFWYL